MLHVAVLSTQHGLKALDFLVNLIFIEVKKIAFHYYADSGEKLGVYAVFVEKVIDISAMATEFMSQPDDTFAVFPQLFLNYVTYVHVIVYLVCIIKGASSFLPLISQASPNTPSRNGQTHTLTPLYMPRHYGVSAIRA